MREEELRGGTGCCAGMRASFGGLGEGWGLHLCQNPPRQPTHHNLPPNPNQQMQNPWSLLDPRDIQDPPRSTRERVLDEVAEQLQDLPVVCRLGGRTLVNLDEAIALVTCLRSTIQPAVSPPPVGRGAELDA